MTELMKRRLRPVVARRAVVWCGAADGERSQPASRDPKSTEGSSR